MPQFSLCCDMDGYSLQLKPVIQLNIKNKSCLYFLHIYIASINKHNSIIAVHLYPQLSIVTLNTQKVQDSHVLLA